MERIETGIFGLDQLIEGGLNEKSTIVIVGSSGTGKTTFGVQFLMHGIENGEQGLFVSLEESPEQIMKEAEAIGIDLRKHYEKDLFFIHLKGKNFKKMVEEQLPQLVKARSDYDIRTRVVIDPITPVLWATEDKLEQRELIGRLFYTLRELGAVVSTVEEHTKPGETVGEDVLLPIYLADGAFHLEYYPIGGAFNRTLKVIKMRGTHHGEGVYPYMFVRGMGVIVRASGTDIAVETGQDYDEVFDKAIQTAETGQAPKPLLTRLKKMKESWDYDYSPEEALHIVFDSYKFK
jgi:KaiC/GvpD/RAD55 family RecA-like ATPase